MASLDQLIQKERAAIGPPQLKRRIHREVRAIFKNGVPRLERIYVPSGSEIPPPADDLLAFVVVLPAPEVTDAAKALQPDAVWNSLIWCLPKCNGPLYDAARDALAWEKIHAEADQRSAQGDQRFRANESLGDARIALREAVWQTYSTVLVPAKRGLRRVNLGLFYSSAAETLTGYIVFRLIQDGHISDGLRRRIGALVSA